MEKTYLKDLNELKSFSLSIPNTPLMAIGKINSLVMLNMRYESKIMINRKLQEHPYGLTARLIQDSLAYLKAWHEISFIENNESDLLVRFEKIKDEIHQKLFQELWTKFSHDDYEQRIQRYLHRLKINDLGENFLTGKSVIDFGCGHGNFAHALHRLGAAYVHGVDFGEKSIQFALEMRKLFDIQNDKIHFSLGSIYQVDQPNEKYDFAIQNGVFHHVEKEDKAISEIHRVLKKGGHLWYYTDPSGGISNDLWDYSVAMLKDIPFSFTIKHLESLNIETGKKYHLGDGLNAIYRHYTWDEITNKLAQFGFGNFRRLKGGFETDSDPDVIEKDRYGSEKFGSGDLRIFAEKLR